MRVSKDRLEEAKRFYKKAVEKYKRAKEEKSDLFFRDAGEKGWNAVVLATNFMIKEITGKPPKSNRDRREILREIESQNGELKRYKFYERFGARAYYLHINCFYEGIYAESELEDNLRKVGSYVRDVEKLTKGG